MLPLCLAAAALKLTRPPSLSHAEVDQLVAQRTRLRSVRDFAAADALKETLESAGVRLQDEVGGGTRWEFAPLALVPELEVGRLGRQAVLLAAAGEAEAAGRGDNQGTVAGAGAARVGALAAAAEARCAEGVAMLGRSAADAAFDFALAGAEGGVIDALASLQAEEFCRWRRPQPLATLQVCERLAAAGVEPSHPVFRRAAAALREAAARAPDEDVVRAALAAAARVEAPVYLGRGALALRPSVWLWRRAIKLRKAQAPTERASEAALRGVRFDCPSNTAAVPSTTAAGSYTTAAGAVPPLVVDSGLPNTAAAAAAGSIADTAAAAAAAAAAAGRAGAVSPLVVDLGCGFGVGLLSLVQPPALAQPVNVLGCDACALKVGYARGVAARWGVSHAARFVCASAEATVAHVAAGDAAAPLLGVMVQFPSPFRVGSASPDGEGGGNGQLPSGADDPSYMLSASLMAAIVGALRAAAAPQRRDGAGWLFVQSNVEDVAVHARAMAEAHGMRAVTGAEEIDEIRRAD